MGAAIIAYHAYHRSDDDDVQTESLFHGAVPASAVEGNDDNPDLEIRWEPEGPEKRLYVHKYPQPNDPRQTVQTHYRVCVVNLSKTKGAIDVGVELEELIPSNLDCVPCHLRLMNHVPPDVTEKFSLGPDGRQFIDVMRWGPTASTFDIWHTVRHQRTDIPAQPYTMKITASAANAAQASETFKIVKDGDAWNMRKVGDPGETPNLTPSPTLLSLMDTAFPSLNKLWGKPILHFPDGYSTQLASALYFDLFTSGAKFLGFYIPPTPRVMEVCTLLAENAIKLGDDLASGGLSVTAKAPGENPQTLSDLTYSGKVYLHHDDMLTHRQMAEVEEIFKTKKLSMVLRGPDFLTQAWLEWKRKHG